MKVQRDGRNFTVDVAADGEGLVSHAGRRCLARSLTGSGSPASFRLRWSAFVSVAGGMIPGRVIRDLAVMLADGGDCLSDLRAVRDQEPLFGAVASDSTAFRLIDRIASEPALLDALRAARAAARERAWGLGVRPERIVIDIDATLVNAHTEKEGAAVNYRSGFGFHPMLAYLDETHEALAGVLRGGGAPAHSAQAQIDVLDLALAQLPVEVVGDLDTEIVMRIDSAGAAGALCQAAQDANIAFLVGFDLFTGVRESILQLPEDAWRPALRQDGQERDGRADRRDHSRRTVGSHAVAGGLAGDHPPRASAPRRAAEVHRRRRASLPSDAHRPHRRHGRDRAVCTAAAGMPRT